MAAPNPLQRNEEASEQLDGPAAELCGAVSKAKDDRKDLKERCSSAAAQPEVAGQLAAVKVRNQTLQKELEKVHEAAACFKKVPLPLFCPLLPF